MAALKCGVGIYVQLSIADFYQEIQKAAEQKMQTITLQDIIDRKVCENKYGTNGAFDEQYSVQRL